MKIIYAFTHKLKDGKEIKLAIRRPTRFELDDADMYFSKFQSECIQKGILTKEMLIKSYKNFGGTLSNKEEKEYTQIFSSFVESKKKFEKAKTRKERDAIQKEIDIYFSSLRDIESEHEQLFDRTADVIARNKTILHLSLLMGVQNVQEDGDSEPIWDQVYSGSEFEDRYIDFCKKEEEDMDDSNSILSRISLFVTFWYYGNKNIKEEDFKKYDDLTKVEFDELTKSDDLPELDPEESDEPNPDIAEPSVDTAEPSLEESVKPDSNEPTASP